MLINLNNKRILSLLCFVLAISPSCVSLRNRDSKSTVTSGQQSPNVVGITSHVDSTGTYDSLPLVSSRLLKSRKYAELDATLAEAREKKTRLVGGYWKLYALYRGLSQPNFGQNAADSEWLALFSNLDEWKREIPTSGFAPIAIAEAWNAYGGIARGDGFINTVSDANLRLFRERNQKAADELNNAKLLSNKCPEWYVAMLRVGLANDWDRRKYDSVFNEGFALEPTYYHLQREKVTYLLPQWNGEDGEVGKFIADISSKIEGDEGDIMYFELLSTLQPEYRSQIFRRTGLLWPKAKIGCDALKKYYGLDSYRKNLLMYLATYGQDVDASIAAMKEVGDDWDPMIWSSKQQFDQIKDGMETMQTIKIASANNNSGPK